jgi:hypothetical protein
MVNWDMPPIPMPCQDMLHRLMIYNPDTGKIYWRKRTADLFTSQKRSAEQICKVWNGHFAGKEAFTAEDSHGYRHGQILGTAYKGSRICWKYFYGTEPDHVDHINGIRNDNRIINLRSVDPRENQKNLRLAKNNSSGCSGVNWHKDAKKWQVRIGHNGIVIQLGLHSDLSTAVAVRKAAEIKYGYHENHGQRVPEVA